MVRGAVLAAAVAWLAMQRTRTRLTVLLLALSLSVAAFVPGCTQPSPQVLCVMRNPQTGQTATMYKEIPFKVPANYDEQKHIAQWKEVQVSKGFTDEVPAPH